MTAPTAYIQIEKIIIKQGQKEPQFVDGYAKDTDPETFTAFYDARRRFQVPFEQASYLVDLYADPDEMVETFPMATCFFCRLLLSFTTEQK